MPARLFVAGDDPFAIGAAGPWADLKVRPYEGNYLFDEGGPPKRRHKGRT